MDDQPAALIAVDFDSAVALTRAIHNGDIAALGALVQADPTLATARFGTPEQFRSSLHIATDWPGNFPNIAATIGALVAAGADVDARFTGEHGETPLHWAASSDDVAAIDALVAAGANLESDGAVFTNGTALSDAVVFGQWAAARRLVELGATMTLWQAAALGHREAVVSILEGAPSSQEVTNALWHCSNGGHRDVAKVLVAHGGDPNWVGWEDLTPIEVAERAGHRALAEWLRTCAAAGNLG